jgi:phosphohistidine phosphatase SixA
MMLADAGIKAIYASEFRRTQDTGKPLAAKLGLTVQAVAAKDAAVLVSKVKAEHPKDVVLIIGHSNTVPEAIKAFGGPAVKMADDEYNAIYVLAPSTGALTLIRY